MGFEYLLDCKANRYFLENGKPDPSYDLNCYPAKMHAATIEAMCDYLKLKLSWKDEALKLARLSAEYLIAIAEPEGSPLAGWPHTYEGKNNTAAIYAGQQMLVYPARAGISGQSSLERYLSGAGADPDFFYDVYYGLDGIPGGGDLRSDADPGRNAGPYYRTGRNQYDFENPGTL